MKTILIPTNNRKPVDISNILEKIGIFNLIRNENNVPVSYSYIDGISGQPERVSNYCANWKNFDIKTRNWQFARINLTKKGEDILKKNGINYIYEN